MNVRRDDHCVRLVPCNAVTDEKNLILRVFFCQHLQEYVHANGVTVRQNKEKRFTCDWLYCAISIPVAVMVGAVALALMMTAAAFVAFLMAAFVTFAVMVTALVTFAVMAVVVAAGVGVIG